MATAQQLNLNPIPPIQPHLIPKKVPIIPVKLGWYGASGDGKTTSAGLFALALSKEIHGGAPVWVTDSEDGWKFLKPIFAMEKVELVIKKVPTFLAMRGDLRDAARAGACVYNVDSLTTIFREWLKACQDKCGFNGQWGSEMRYGWTDFVQQFITSPIHCQCLGRIKDVEEEMIVDNDGNTKKLKTGDKLNAGGAESFTFEPHLTIRLSRERKDKVKRGLRLEHEGRVIHRADIEKDRTWALNTRIFRWNDLTKYEPGAYREVWKSLRPHFLATQATGDNTTIDPTQNSQSLIPENEGSGEYYARRQRKEAMSAEIKGCLDVYFAGQAKEEKQVRLAVCDLIFGVKSAEARDTLSLEALERGLRILHAYQKFPQHQLDSQAAVLKQMAEAIEEYDRGQSEEWDIPF